MNINNIILIGMPNSGKSTVGSYLAKALGRRFIDTDQLILEKAKKPLKDIVNFDGLDKFLSIQDEVINSLDAANSVIATGGSVIYGEASMSHLKAMGTVIFLDISYETVVSRLSPGRRFAREEGKSLLDVYNERKPLYQKYADITIDCSVREAKDIAEDIIKQLNLK
ncbi:shikimate kinase [Pseudoclostridium thermosuccinogenes]|nr:shikimate kinase [Pseudoclostridium thermosuccinogenes]